MFGRFDPAFGWTAGHGKLIVSGTLEQCAAGSQVRIDACITQKAKSVSCNGTFTAPTPSAPFAWSMEVSAPFATATAGGLSFPWVNGAPIDIT
jgi:hypothetical protein